MDLVDIKSLIGSVAKFCLKAQNHNKKKTEFRKGMPSPGSESKYL